MDETAHKSFRASAAAVVGLGKIGLPLAVQFASRGVRVIGCDIDASVVAAVNSGMPHFPGEAGLAELLPDLVASDMLSATTDTAAAVARVDAVVVVVPLLVDDSGEPSFAAMDAATAAIGAGLHAGQLVSYETTLPIGTTRGRFLTALEAASGLQAGSDFFLAFSPERVFSGRILSDLRRYPKLVGGVDRSSGRAAVDFYGQVLEFDHRDDLPRANGVWDLGSAEAAEFVKLAETTYRDVNIGLANEFAARAEELGIDVGEVIAAANSQPYSHIHQPGIVGGHCIPVYPYFYMAGDPNASITASARSTNESVAARLIKRAAAIAGGLSGKRAAVLGAAYRGGVKETAFSGVFPLVRALEAEGAAVTVHDPLFSDDELGRLGFAPHTLGTPCDIVIVHTDHDRYRDLSGKDLPECKLLVDVRRIVDPSSLPTDVTVLALGVGTS